MKVYYWPHLVETMQSSQISIGRLVVWALRPFETVFQSISDRLPERGRKKKREMIDERKMSKPVPPAPTAGTVGPCPTIIQISRTPRHWKFTQHHRTTRVKYQRKVHIYMRFRLLSYISVGNWCRNDVVSKSVPRIDVNTTSFLRHVHAGIKYTFARLLF